MARRVYLDACCLHRPFDDQSQTRIRLEAEAILLIIERLAARGWEWVGSDVLAFEVGQNPDPDSRQRVGLLMTAIQRTVSVEASIVQRAEALQAAGFKAYDALHIACAERARVEVLLTTDDRMLRLARRGSVRLKVEVRNPLDWVREVR